MLFSTDAVLVDPELLVLVDDRGLQPAENVIPAVRVDALLRWGSDLATALDAVSAHLTTEELTNLNDRAGHPDADLADVVKAWLRERGLTA